MEKEQDHISWHPAFVEALQLELEDYRDHLEFFPEYQLSSEPLKIDCVVIKKAKGVEIKKNIAAIFRGVNIVEYKSPGDYVSVSDFYKVYGYACLYAYLNKTQITDMTISFVESRNPRRLLAHLRKIRGYTVEESQKGIYTVSGDILPIQIIDSRWLEAEENLWLRGLGRGLNTAMVVSVVNAAALKPKDTRLDAYIDVVFRANNEVLEELIRMSNSAKTLEEVLESTGIFAKRDAMAEERAKERAVELAVELAEAREEARALAIAKKMVEAGYPLETVVSMTSLEPEKVQELFN